MNIEQAKAIPIVEILAKLELKPTKETATDATYLSPWRNEKTPSFKVNKETNEWYDHGGEEPGGGNAFDLVIKILKHSVKNHTAIDALRWIRNTNLDPVMPKPRDLLRDRKSKWQLIEARPLKKIPLSRYLEDRGINVALAKKYVCEIHVQHKISGTYVFGIGFKNEDGGYELRNRFFKSAVAPKTITFIRGDSPKPKGVMVFEGFMDFLTYITIKKGKLRHDVIILNSVACVDHAVRYIKNYCYQFIYTFMNNDKAGTKAQQRLIDFIKYEPGLTHKPMNYVYPDHNDLNEWHMHVHRLKPIN